MARTYRAFVSSTFLDLKEQRAYVIDQLEQAGFDVDPMEKWPADANEPKVLSKERVEGCDLCILLVARRRGHIPTGDLTSVTQQEYEYARQLGIDVLVFALDDKAAWHAEFDERRDDAQVGRWRGDLQGRHTWSQFGYLPQTIQILPAAARWLQKQREESPDILHWLGRPASLEGGFVGREEDMAALAEAFTDHRAAVISGGPGTGKSRLAAEYTHQAQVPGFWGDGADAAARTLAALAPALDIDASGKSEDELAAAVQRRLAECSADTLWLIDNLPELGPVNELLAAAGPVRLLITTRDGRRELLSPNVAFHELHELDSAPAVALLLSRRATCKADDPALPKIAELVGELPLALEMLAMRLAQPGQTPAKLLMELEDSPSAIQLKAFEDAAGVSLRRANGVYATITGALAALPPDLRDAVSPLGYVADAPVPLPLFQALTGLSGPELERLIETCRSCSLLRVSDDDTIIHALTSAAIAATNEAMGLPLTVGRAISRLASTYHDKPGVAMQEMSHYERAHTWARQVMGGDSPDVVRLAIVLAAARSEAGRFAEDDDLTDEALRRAVRVLGPEDVNTLWARNNLAVNYWHLRRYEEARALNEENLAIRSRVLGAEHPDTLRSRLNLAIDCAALGRHADALALNEETLCISERVLGPEHPNTLSSRHSLAGDYRNFGRFQEALALDEETLRLRERVLGPGHPDTLRSKHNLSTDYANAGRPAEALALDEETLASRERVLGPEHPEALDSRNNLAIQYSALGRYDQALALDEETLRIRQRVLGPEHPDTLTSRNNLAGDYRNVGRHEVALAVDEITLPLMERVLGASHPHTRSSRSNLALDLRALGRDEEADGLGEEADRIERDREAGSA